MRDVHDISVTPVPRGGEDVDILAPSFGVWRTERHDRAVADECIVAEHVVDEGADRHEGLGSGRPLEERHEHGRAHADALRVARAVHRVYLPDLERLSPPRVIVLFAERTRQQCGESGESEFRDAVEQCLARRKVEVGDDALELVAMSDNGEPLLECGAVDQPCRCRDEREHLFLHPVENCHSTPPKLSVNLIQNAC